MNDGKYQNLIGEVCLESGFGVKMWCFVAFLAFLIVFIGVCVDITAWGEHVRIQYD